MSLVRDIFTEAAEARRAAEIELGRSLLADGFDFSVLPPTVPSLHRSLFRWAYWEAVWKLQRGIDPTPGPHRKQYVARAVAGAREDFAAALLENPALAARCGPTNSPETA